MVAHGGANTSDETYSQRRKPNYRSFYIQIDDDWNATQAAAGYSAKSARSQASDLLTIPNIQEALAEVMKADAERCKVSVDRAIGELVKIAFVNMMDYMRIGENGDPYVECPP